MDFFTINQANGILPINMDALHGDLVGVASFTNGGLPLSPPIKLSIEQVVDIWNGGAQVPPPKKLTVTPTIDIWNGDVQLPPPKK